MKGTKLWHQAGSPLIQGRSQRERPFVTDLAIALVIAFAAALGGWMLVLTGRGVLVLDALSFAALPAAAGALLGASTGVWLASGFGWHPRWIAGVALGAVLAAGAVWPALP